MLFRCFDNGQLIIKIVLQFAATIFVAKDDNQKTPPAVVAPQEVSFLYVLLRFSFFVSSKLSVLFIDNVYVSTILFFNVETLFVVIEPRIVLPLAAVYAVGFFYSE